MEDGEIIGMDELSKKYPHEWLAVEVLERDVESGQPVTVQLLSRNADINSVRVNIRRDEYCIVYTGSIPEVNYVAMF